MDSTNKYQEKEVTGLYLKVLSIKTVQRKW